jgi:hypothetical protein
MSFNSSDKTRFLFSTLKSRIIGGITQKNSLIPQLLLNY